MPRTIAEGPSLLVIEAIPATCQEALSKHNGSFERPGFIG
jgi:hypothetical protein